jgi:predicted nucleic acid-binding protein
MSGDAVYVDTSAFLKLLVEEAESSALRARLPRWRQRASSGLLRTETLRALRRSGNGRLSGPARQMFAALHLIRVDEQILDRAGELEPDALRSLDAIHLSSALSLGSDLAALVTYDQRLADAAAGYGIAVESPA